ncbi:MAG TPA: uracil-DNA glycosylase [Puia sp.]|jgi:uracil-DNA glycosylase
MTPVIDIEKVKNQLYAMLKPSGWSNKLKGFLLSSDFDLIIAHLVAQVEIGKRFTPPLRNLLTAFEQCPYDELKVVIIATDPYPQLGIADGIPFSCSLTGKEQPALRRIFNALQTELPETYGREVDLKRWSNQGILLLNTALTCQIGSPGSHLDIWKPFTTYLLDTINYENRGLVFIFLGDHAAGFSDLIGDHHYKMLIEHPADMAHTGKPWDHQELFTKVNTILGSNYQAHLTW